MRKRPLCFFCLFFLVFRLSVLLVQGNQAEDSARFPSKTMQIEGTILQKAITSKQQVLTVANQKHPQKEKIIVYDDSFCDVKIGERILVKGEGKSFEEARNPGNFNQREYYRKKNTKGFVWAKEIFIIEPKKISVGECFFQIRETSRNILESCLGEKNGGILAAMLLGEKAGMDPEVKELYQKNGISHLLAISGVCFLCWVFLIGERMA